MTKVLERALLEITEIVSLELGGALDVSSMRRIVRPNDEEPLGDSTFALLVDGKSAADNIVLLVSNAEYSNTVSVDLARASSVAKLVDSDVGGHIVKPLLSGAYEGQAYAAFSRLHLMSENRFLRFYEKNIAAPKIISWCTSLAKQTQKRLNSDQYYNTRFIEPLEWLRSDSECPAQIQNLAHMCLEDVTNSKRDLWTSVEHGDLWIGNILFEYRSRFFPSIHPDKFHVIDWRGSKDDGYPCIDAIRFLLSIYKFDNPHSISLFRSYTEKLCISNFEVSIYSMLSLGCLSRNLDLFPREHFYGLCEMIYEFLQTRGYTKNY